MAPGEPREWHIRSWSKRVGGNGGQHSSPLGRSKSSISAGSPPKTLPPGNKNAAPPAGETCHVLKDDNSGDENIAAREVSAKRRHLKAAGDNRQRERERIAEVNRKAKEWFRCPGCGETMHQTGIPSHITDCADYRTLCRKEWRQ